MSKPHLSPKKQKYHFIGLLTVKYPHYWSINSEISSLLVN